MNVEALRAQTPGCKGRIHLNNAGSSLMPMPVLQTIQEHLTLEANIGGYEAADAREDAIADAYLAVGDLVDASPRNIAFTENATASYIQALSSIPFEKNDVILTTRNDYVSNQIHFLSLQKRMSVQIVRAPDLPSGGVDVNAFDDLIRHHHPKLVCVTHVPTNSGLVQDVKSVGQACRLHDVPYLVDACQSVGQMPVSVKEIGCDFLSATSRKFLRGPRGAGFLYVSDRILERGVEPLFIDMRGADWIDHDRYRSSPDARRFENWEFAWALVLGTGRAARYALDTGLVAIRERTRALAHRLRTALVDIDGVECLDRGDDLCGLVSITTADRDPPALVNKLREAGINTNAQQRIYAVLDYDAKGVTSSLRISPHYFNTEDEVDRCVAVLADLLKGSSLTSVPDSS